MSTAPEKHAFRAGAAQVEITPEMGVQLAGDIGRCRPAELVIDPIYAKALVIEAGDRKVCILSLDLLAITTEWSNELRRRAAAEFDLDFNAVMVHIVQNHATPAMGHFMIRETPYIPPELSWLRGGDERYDEYAAERIIDAIRLADSALEPVSIGAASGIEARVAFNRRFILRDGTARMGVPWGELHKVLQPEGPMDPELGVVCLTTKSLRKVAMLLHHTCHPCHGYPYRFVIGDWPGEWSQRVRDTYGLGCVPLVINGCCGNIIHRNSLDPTQADTSERMGQLLTETTLDVLKRIRYEETGGLDYHVKHIRIPLRTLTDKVVDDARQLLKDHPEPMWRDEAHTAVEWKWVYAVSILDLYDLTREQSEFDYEIQAFRIGDVALVALTGEPFVEGQLQIKLRSPAYPTYIAHMSNGYVGYIPTQLAFKGGGYETDTCTGSKLAPEALDMIVDETVALLKEMF